MIKRYISAVIRQNKRRKVYKDLVLFVENAMSEIKQIPIPERQHNVLMLVRMDEIGDYILTRNLFSSILNSEKFKNHKIVYVGNASCQMIAEELDSTIIDSFLWIDKKLFKNESYYRTEIFKKIRNIAPSAVIELERTTDISIGDLLVYASHATERFGSVNHYQNQLLNQLSSSFYSDVYANSWSIDNQLEFNQKFINWICGSNIILSSPTIKQEKTSEKGKYIVCLIGPYKTSKNWPLSNWMILLKRISMQYNGKIMLVSLDAGDAIKRILQLDISPNIIPIENKVPINGILSLIANATMVITNDNNATYISIALSTSEILAITDEIYVSQFSTLRKNGLQVIFKTNHIKYLPLINPEERWFYKIPSRDLETIRVAEVLALFTNILKTESISS